MPGAITFFVIVSGGTGYAVGDEGDIVQGIGIDNRSAEYVVDTVDGSGAVTSVLPLGFGFLLPTRTTTRGCGYMPGMARTNATSGGGSGMTIRIIAVGPGTDATHGKIGDFAINNTGTGYAAGDTGEITQGMNHTATYTIEGVIAGGVVAGLRFIDKADGYAVGTNVATSRGGPQIGGGSGLTFDIISVFACRHSQSPGGPPNRYY